MHHMLDSSAPGGWYGARNLLLRQFCMAQEASDMTNPRTLVEKTPDV
jgi:hypothetical protein